MLILTLPLCETLDFIAVKLSFTVDAFVPVVCFSAITLFLALSLVELSVLEAVFLATVAFVVAVVVFSCALCFSEETVSDVVVFADFLQT